MDNLFVDVFAESSYPSGGAGGKKVANTPQNASKAKPTAQNASKAKTQNASKAKPQNASKRKIQVAKARVLTKKKTV